MGDEENRPPVVAKIPQRVEKSVAILDVDRRGRLIENEETPWPQKRARDADKLATGERKTAREFLNVEAGHAHDRERFAHEFGFSRRIGFAPNDPIQTEHHVVADRHLRKDQGLLEDGGDSRCLRCARGRDSERLAVPFKRSRLGTDDPAQNLDERALARAVLPDNGMNLARSNRNRARVQRDRLAKGAAKVLGLQQGMAKRRMWSGLAKMTLCRLKAHTRMLTCGSRP